MAVASLTTAQVYVASVTYEIDGETRTLALAFQGGPTDYYWNHATARDFYAQRITDEGGIVRCYGVRGPSPALADHLARAAAVDA